MMRAAAAMLRAMLMRDDAAFARRHIRHAYAMLLRRYCHAAVD